MNDHVCVTCGNRLEFDNGCPVCRLTMVIATQEHAVPTRISPTPNDGAFQPGDPPPPTARPPLQKDLPQVLLRWLRPLLIGGMVMTALGLLVLLIRHSYAGSIHAQSINNLKQIGLAFHSFHDANKRLPYNGTTAPYRADNVWYGGPALAGDNTTGSWAFMILPFLEQATMFQANDTNAGVAVFLCPGRGRRPLCTGTGGPGAWTDYFLNSFLNDPNGAFDVPDTKLTLVKITDGMSNTVFVGHGQIKPKDYRADHTLAGFTDVIFHGGSPGLCRPNCAVVLGPDSNNSAPGNWGGPFSQGALMAMADGTVRTFPYIPFPAGTIKNGEAHREILPGGDAGGSWMGFGCFLTPQGGESFPFIPD